jgi:C1A family cysteine protease
VVSQFLNQGGLPGYQSLTPCAASLKLGKAVTQNSPAALKQTLLSTPVVSIICITDSFFYYSSGIYSAPCNCTINHALMVVGYDDEQGFWKFKNLWAPAGAKMDS